MTYASRELQQLDEIEDMLQAYAEARLSPSGPVLSRMRTAVLAEAALAAATEAADRRAIDPDDVKPSRWALPRFVVPRRAFTMVGVAGLALVSTTAVLAAPPGSPFYEARVAIEAAFLPTDIDARLAAHEARIAERLVAAQAAAASGNPDALEAALAAYAAEVDAAVADLGSNKDLLAHLEEVLGKHVIVLTALEAKVPEQASVDRAIERSQKAVEKIKEKKGGPSNGGPNSGPNGGPDGGRPDEVPTGQGSAPGR